MKTKIKTAELFAGVGGFRLGLEKAHARYHIAWSNQWEPSTKKQTASNIYIKNFGEENHSNKDIATVPTSSIPDHDLLVGGFPCQDYSVARPLNQATGITGKKGVLWWQVHRILQEKGNKKPHYLFLENVDRLIKSPANQRGRDFAIILASLAELGYIVEWRVINAADYGMPQKRRRIFLIGYHKKSNVAKRIKGGLAWIKHDGVFAKAFKADAEDDGIIEPFELDNDLASITSSFNKNNKTKNPFHNTGIIIGKKVWSIQTKPNYSGKQKKLKDILLPLSQVPEGYFIDEKDIDKWQYLKGSKKEPRKKNNGETFFYAEGAMPFPDCLENPARTIITSEGGKTPSRFKHVVLQKGKLRRLTPIELERINMFPDNHTIGATDSKRAFFMGNALVVGVIEKVGKYLMKAIENGR